MGKKFMNTVLFLAVTVAAATLTAYVGKGSGNVLLYNFAFLGLMLIIYAVGLFAGLYRMDNLSRALKHGSGSSRKLKHFCDLTRAMQVYIGWITCQEH